MATFSKRGNAWRAQIRKAGRKPISKTFPTLAKAKVWATDIEAQLDSGRPIRPSGKHSVSKLIEAYRDLRDASRPVLDTSNEHYMLNHLEAFLGDKTVLVPQDLVDFAKWRKKEGAGPYTINMEISKLGTALKYAGAALQLELPDVVGKARPLLTHLGLIGGGGKRERRPTEDELSEIIKALPEHFRDVIRFMVATAMRRGEVCRLRWDDLDREKRLILVRDRKDPRRKAGNDQWVPLLGDAWKIVNERLRVMHSDDSDVSDASGRGDGAIWPIHPQTLSKIFKTTCDALSIPDLHLHDLRHEGISRMFEQGMDIQHVSLVSGHADWRHLRRYTNLRPEDLHALAPGTGRNTRPRPARLRIVSRRGKSE